MSLAATLLVALTLPAGPAAAAGTGDDGAAKAKPISPPPTVSVHRGQGAAHVPPIWIEHRGSFRFRPELLLNGDLGGGGSPIPRPIAANTGDVPDARTLSWASIRLRYEPTIHVGPSLSINLGIDALDNLVLGSTHVLAGGDHFINIWDDKQAPPAAGINSWMDAVKVRKAYGEFFGFHWLYLKGGRMPANFGLGILRNDGSCADCNFGTIVDGADIMFSMGNLRLSGSVEYQAQGLIQRPIPESGQAVDLGLDDNTPTFTVQFGSRPVSKADWVERDRALNERREWVMDWSLFSSFTSQDATSLAQVVDTSVECVPDEIRADGTPVLDYDCSRLYRRNAFVWRPGAWLRIEGRPAFGKTLRLEFEFAAMIGDIVRPQRLETVDLFEPKDLSGFGSALEIEYQTGNLGLGFDWGFATGDDRRYLGVLDGQNIVEPNDDLYNTNLNVRTNRTITSFWFHRDYRIDLILFRQIIGAVTNTIYFKPYVSTDILNADGNKLTLRLDALYAMSAKPSGTPGQGRHYGVELDGRLSYTTASGFGAHLMTGVLFPFDALRNRDTGKYPSPAFTLQGRFDWNF